MSSKLKLLNQHGDTITLENSDLARGDIVIDAGKLVTKEYVDNGVVQLENTLTSTSTVKALTAAQGKVLQDWKVDKTKVVTTAITSVTFNADGTLTIVVP